VAKETFSVKLEIKDPKLKSKFETVFRKIGGFSIQGPTSKGSSDLMVFELGDEFEKELLFVQDMLSSGEVAEVFFASDNTDPAILRSAIRVGAREFFNKPL
jgi:hypothetical protein